MAACARRGQCRPLASRNPWCCGGAACPAGAAAAPRTRSSIGADAAARAAPTHAGPPPACRRHCAAPHARRHTCALLRRSLQPVRFVSGDVVVRQGAPSDAMFIILSGEAASFQQARGARLRDALGHCLAVASSGCAWPWPGHAPWLVHALQPPALLWATAGGRPVTQSNFCWPCSSCTPQARGPCTRTKTTRAFPA